MLNERQSNEFERCFITGIVWLNGAIENYHTHNNLRLFLSVCDRKGGLISLLCLLCLIFSLHTNAFQCSLDIVRRTDVKDCNYTSVVVYYQC